MLFLYIAVYFQLKLTVTGLLIQKEHESILTRSKNIWTGILMLFVDVLKSDDKPAPEIIKLSVFNIYSIVL